ncbi:MAG: hypothetical protein LBP34_06910 [Flavobacteriaceae bacterium]|nr:hypothetical protein [Flavobacteriaceae bacterium]
MPKNKIIGFYIFLIKFFIYLQPETVLILVTGWLAEEKAPLGFSLERRSVKKGKKKERSLQFKMSSLRKKKDKIIW